MNNTIGTVLRRLLSLKLAIIALLVVASLAGVVRADCSAWENLKKARQNAEDANNAYKKIVLPPNLEKQIQEHIGLQALNKLSLNPDDLDLGDNLEGNLTDEERKELLRWMDARKLRDKADAEYKKAQEAYRVEMDKKDAALKQAEEDFAKEQQWLESEKQAIQSMPRDDKYLDRVSQITKRLKGAYEKMQRDLEGYRECFPDARKFLDDKDERLKKIAALDAEIARRRGGVATTLPATQPGDKDDQTVEGGDQQPVIPGEGPPPGPMGDTWVCDGPVVKVTNGTFTTCDASGFSFEVEVNGQKVRSSVKITKAPPLTVRINQRVELVMVASGDPAALNHGMWHTNNVIAGQLPSDNGCSNLVPGRNYKGEGNPTTATVRFYFGPGQDPFIRMYGGQAGDAKTMEIVWKYRKK